MAATDIRIPSSSSDLPDCLTCDVMGDFVPAVASGTRAMAENLWGGIAELSIPLAILVFTIYSTKGLFGGDLSRIVKDAMCFIIAAGLLVFQGPTIVNDVFDVTLATAGNAAAVVLDSVPFESGIQTSTDLLGSSDSSQTTSGMVKLAGSVEKNIYKVFIFCEAIWHKAGWSGWQAYIIAPLIFIPFALLLVSYFCLLIVSIVSVQLVALFSPIIIMMSAFKWSRGWIATSLRVLVSIVMVMIASSAIVALICWVTHLLGIGDVSTKDQISDNLTLANAAVWTAILTGWAGPALMVRATNLANSLTGSMLGSAESAVLAGGVFGSAAYAARLSGAGAGLLWDLGKWGTRKTLGGGGKDFLKPFISPR